MTATHLWTKTANQMARGLAYDTADGLKDEANLAIVEAESLLSKLRTIGAGRFSILKLQEGLTECFQDAQAEIDRVLDDQGALKEGYRLDYSDVVA